MITAEGAALDSAWTGAPGEPIPSGVRLRVTNPGGDPIPAALVSWSVTGKGSSVRAVSTFTDRNGEAFGAWVLGTDAAEQQQLRVTVRTSVEQGQILIVARAIPHVVKALTVSLDTPVVLRVGDTLLLHPAAVDPYGNVIPSPSLSYAIADTTHLVEREGLLVAGPRRGRAEVLVSSQSVTTKIPVQVVQYVQSITAVSDTIQLNSVGAQQALPYVVRDDRGAVVLDTTATVSVLDSNVVQVQEGQVRSIAPGTSHVLLSIGSINKVLTVVVRQRVTSIKFGHDTIRFDALFDTVALQPIALDSLGAVVVGPRLSLAVGNQQVAKFVGPLTLQALAPGDAAVTAYDSSSGVSATVQIRVHQIPVDAGISIRQQDGFTFSATGDSAGAVWAVDHNGFRIPFNRFAVRISDSAAVTVDSTGTVRALRSGETQIVATIDTMTPTVDMTVVLPVQVLAANVPGFEIVGLPDSLGPWAPTAVPMPDGTTRLFFTGYVYDTIQSPPFSGSLHYATSADGVHFTYSGVALPRDSGYSGYRSQGVENVFMLPRDDGPGCRLLAAAGSSWWIWQIYSAVADDCTSWRWEEGPALPGVIENDTIGRPIGEGIDVWKDSTGSLWMLTGAYPATYGGVRTWTVGLYRGSDQRHWEFVRTVLYPGPPGSGRERAVGAPAVVAVGPGLYRMFFSGDDIGIAADGGRSRIWSAVSHDRLTWVFEGAVLDFQVPTRGPRYPTVVGDKLYFVNSGPGFGAHLSAAQIRQP